jgi:Asp-tRNA(Asn)/Glu-tRNA(Gln) amidotransferase B subunit
MGLDMYLSKKTYVKQWEHKGEDNFNVEVTQKGEPVQHIKRERISYVVEEVGYWRKANQIHNWLVQNVQEGEDDCGEYDVHEEQLEELLELCKKVLANNELAKELLPSQSGFFFGGTTIEIIETLLSERNEDGYLDGSIYYQSSW